MTQETRLEHIQATDESSQAFIPAGDSNGLNAWNAEQLVAEVITRYADDAPALRRLQTVALEACLAAIDRQAAPIAR